MPASCITGLGRRERGVVPQNLVRRETRAAMMQPADHGEGDDLPPIGGLALAEVMGVVAEREVGPGPVIVLEVLPQDAAR